MNSVMLYEEWLHLGGDDSVSFSVMSELNNLQRGLNNAWIKTGKPWLNSLSESIMASFSMDDFKNEVLPHLNESSDYTSIRESYAIYELALLETHRPDWFLNEDRIMVLPNYDEHKVVLCKNKSFFALSMSTWSLINENFFSDAFDKGKELAGSAWDSLKSGAQKVWGFISKIASASWDYVQENPFEALAIAVNIIGGIAAFVPAAGQAAAPVCAILAGGFEIAQGGVKVVKGMGKLAEITDEVAKDLAIAASALPYMAAGAASIFLGLNGMLTAIADAAPGVLGLKFATKQKAKKVATKLGETWGGKLEHGLEHIIADYAKKFVKESMVKSVKLASKNATALLLILLVKVLKGGFGGIAEKLVQGIGKIGELFDFLLDTPKKITSLIENMKGDSYAAKLIQGALQKVVKPLTSWASTFIDKNIKPLVTPITSYLQLLPTNYKAAVDLLNKHKDVDVEMEEIPIQYEKVETEDIKMSPEEKAKIKALEKGEGGKSGGSGASGGSITKVLKDRDPNFKGFKTKAPDKLTVELEGSKKTKGWKEKMSINDFVEKMKSDEWKNYRFQYDGEYPTDLHSKNGGSYARLKAIKESAILPFNEWISR